MHHMVLMQLYLPVACTQHLSAATANVWPITAAGAITAATGAHFQSEDSYPRKPKRAAPVSPWLLTTRETMVARSSALYPSVTAYPCHMLELSRLFTPPLTCTVSMFCY